MHSRLDSRFRWVGLLGFLLLLWGVGAYFLVFPKHDDLTYLSSSKNSCNSFRLNYSSSAPKHPTVLGFSEMHCLAIVT